MNVLFITVAWPAPGSYNLYSDLMLEFKEHGHCVYAVSLSATNDGKTIETIENGLHTLRVDSGNVQKTNKYLKVINSFLGGSRIRKAIKQFYGDISFDLIIFTTPPITMTLDVIRLKKHYKASLYLLLKDIWPQDTVDIGGMRKGGLVWRVFRWLEVQTYKAADYIGCMSPASKNYVLAENSYVSPQKVEVCPNSQKDRANEIIKDAAVRARYGIDDNAILMIYGGNIGVPQGIDFLFDIASEIKNDPRLFLLIVGGGTEYERLKNELEKIQAENVSLIPTIDKYEYDSLVAASDIGLILLHPNAEVPNFPSRLLSYIQVGKPVIAAVDEATDIGKIVEHYVCGKWCKNGDLEGFMNAVEYYLDSKNRTLASGNARKLFLDCYTTDKGYEIIMSHFGGDGLDGIRNETAFSGEYKQQR